MLSRSAALGLLSNLAWIDFRLEKEYEVLRSRLNPTAVVEENGDNALSGGTQLRSRVPAAAAAAATATTTSATAVSSTADSTSSGQATTRDKASVEGQPAYTSKSLDKILIDQS